MGQIFNRLKFLARAQLNAISKKIKKVKDVLTEPDDDPESEKTSADIDKEWEELMKDVGWKKSEPKVTDPELARLAKSYEDLQLELGTPLDKVSARLKELVIKNHPDKFLKPEEKAKASAYVAKVTQAFHKIKDYWENRSKRRF